jgi:GPI-anchor transamidase subunit GAA1
VLTFLASILLLRGDPRLRKLPPYLSFFCIIIGVAWLLLLPLNEYSRRTYVSENALLPGQVHTYFAGSDQNIFRGLKHEVDALAEEGNDMSVDYILWRSSQILTCIQRKQQA